MITKRQMLDRLARLEADSRLRFGELPQMGMLRLSYNKRTEVMCFPDGGQLLCAPEKVGKNKSRLLPGFDDAAERCRIAQDQCILVLTTDDSADESAGEIS